MVSRALIQEATDSQSLLTNKLMEEASLHSESIISHQPSSLLVPESHSAVEILSVSMALHL
jgi:hypothetical protein